MSPASREQATTELSIDRPAGDASPDLERSTGIVMAVHRVDGDAARCRIGQVARERGVPLADLARATAELVSGAAPRNPVATVVAMRFLLGRLAYGRPVLDGQVHSSVRDAAADMHPGPDPDVEGLLGAADQRDRDAEQRDLVAQGRDDVPGDDRDREQAALDRAWAARDRDCSAGDRADLAERLRRPPSGPAGSTRR